MVMLPVRWWRVGIILTKEALAAPSFAYLHVIYLWIDVSRSSVIIMFLFSLTSYEDNNGVKPKL